MHPDITKWLLAFNLVLWKDRYAGNRCKCDHRYSKHRRNIGSVSSTCFRLRMQQDSPDLNTEEPIKFKGKHKWLGGAVLDSKDGTAMSIFGIPSNTDNVIQITIQGLHDENYSSAVVKNIGLPRKMRHGRYKWLRGIVVDDHLFGIPAWNNAGVLKMRLNASDLGDVGTPHILPLPSKATMNKEINVNDYLENGTADNVVRTDRWMWHGAALSSDEKYIYCVPSNKERVLKVKVDSNAEGPDVEEIGPCFPGKNKWYGGIRGHDGCIYGAPYTASGILRIDPKDDSVKVLGDFGSGEWKWHGGVLCSNGCIFCFPSHSDYALKIDTSKDSHYSLIKLPPTRDKIKKYKWLGGALGQDGAVYAIPCDTNSVLRIDPETDAVALFGLTPDGKNKWQGGVLGLDGFIYAVPADAGTVLKIDTRPPFDASDDNERRVTCIGVLPDEKKKFQGGFLAADGCIYAIPECFDHILKVEPSTSSLHFI